MYHIEELLTKLDRVRGSGSQYMACCPAHDDRSPSLAIKEVDGKILMNCMAGCNIQEITSAMGIQLKDLFADSSYTTEQRKKYRKIKNLSKLWGALFLELHVLLQIVNNRVCDETLSKNKRFTENRPDFKALPPEFWERELLAANRVKRIIGDIYGL